MYVCGICSMIYYIQTGVQLYFWYLGNNFIHLKTLIEVLNIYENILEISKINRDKKHNIMCSVVLLTFANFCQLPKVHRVKIVSQICPFKRIYIIYKL